MQSTRQVEKQLREYGVNFTTLSVPCLVHRRNHETDTIVTFYISVLVLILLPHSVNFQVQCKIFLYNMHSVLEHKNFIQQVHMVVVAMEYIQVFKELTENMVMGCA